MVKMQKFVCVCVCVLIGRSKQDLKNVNNYQKMCQEPGTVLSKLHLAFHSVLRVILYGRYNQYKCFLGTETKAQRGYKTGWKSHAYMWLRTGIRTWLICLQDSVRPAPHYTVSCILGPCAHEPWSRWSKAFETALLLYLTASPVHKVVGPRHLSLTRFQGTLNIF